MSSALHELYGQSGRVSPAPRPPASTTGLASCALCRSCGPRVPTFFGGGGHENFSIGGDRHVRGQASPIGNLYFDCTGWPGGVRHSQSASQTFRAGVSQTSVPPCPPHPCSLGRDATAVCHSCTLTAMNKVHHNANSFWKELNVNSERRLALHVAQHPTGTPPLEPRDLARCAQIRRAHDRRDRALVWGDGAPNGGDTIGPLRDSLCRCAAHGAGEWVCLPVSRNWHRQYIRPVAGRTRRRLHRDRRAPI